jgi:hypothetical protein
VAQTAAQIRGRRDASAEKIEFADQHAGDLDRRVLDPEIETMHLRAPDQLRTTLDDVGQAERHHEQRDRWLTRHRPQDELLDGDAEHDHDDQRDQQCDREGNALLMQADEGQRREEQHRPLREIQHAGCLVDQNEADRDQRIHDADCEPRDQNLAEETPGAHAASTTSSPSPSWATPR